MFDSVAQVEERLRDQAYICDRKIATVVFLAHKLEKPVLVEGPAGVGKTELAKVVAAATGRNLIRLQSDLLVDVPEDDVVAALVPLDLTRLAAPDVVADHLLQREGAVLGHVAQPGALVEPLDERGRATARVAVLTFLDRAGRTRW